MAVRHRWAFLVPAILAVSLALPAAAVFEAGVSGATEPGAIAQAATALGSAFTYQGRLDEGGGPAAGVYDFRFILYDAEAGGSQIGPTLDRPAVTVVRGFFTVELDFGEAPFRGEGRWLEVAVRETGSPSFYNVLSPRQPVLAVPYALFARAADLTLPFAGAGESPAPSQLFTLTQNGSGTALEARRTYDDATEAPAIFGLNAGAGAGVQGESSAGGGTGVRGLATGIAGIGVQGSAPDGLGGALQGDTGAKILSTSGAVALELAGGALRMTGDPSPAFVHVVVTEGDGANVCGANGTVLDNSLLNATPDAVVMVSPLSSAGAIASAADARAVVLAYAPTTTCAAAADRWVIFAGGAPLAAGETFNVLVVNR